MAIRLDKFLTGKNPSYSRNKINNLIKNGCAYVNDHIEYDPSYGVKEQDVVKFEVKPELDYVSRAALKLVKALEEFNIDLKDKVCLDIGCSTGGFSQVMLQNGAKFIYSVDVGTDQFNKDLLKSNKIKLMEQTNFCTMQLADFDMKIDFIACDVSFISSKKILDRVKFIFNYPFKFILLIKPQFELTKEILDECKGSVPAKYHNQAISSVCAHAKSLGFEISKVIESPILGAKGNNKEFIVCLTNK